jgi:hypothetical protein
MDFRQTVQPGARPAAPVAADPAAATNRHEPGKQRFSSDSGGGKWLRLLSAIILFGVAILIAAVAFAFTNNKINNESGFVNAKQYQAVFLNNGQVYFGKIADLNNKFVRMNDIFYLTQNTTTDSNGQATSDGNYTLVKLGCQQIHDPTDQMLINREQVTFWENLQDDGKVVSSIKDFQKQNPNGPDCSQVSNQTQASTNAGTQGGNAANTTENKQ